VSEPRRLREKLSRGLGLRGNILWLDFSDNGGHLSPPAVRDKRERHSSSMLFWYFFPDIFLN
jgi:hypothetical protein